MKWFGALKLGKMWGLSSHGLTTEQNKLNCLLAYAFAGKVVLPYFWSSYPMNIRSPKPELHLRNLGVTLSARVSYMPACTVSVTHAEGVKESGG